MDNKNKNMKYITVLDFEAGRVFQYKNEVVDFSNSDAYEEYLTEQGHNLTNCEFMVHSDPRVITD
tara:strand:+ start:520 stop:714 length:195 start_codon:yes stop_codon:yes gene_type:complete